MGEHCKNSLIALDAIAENPDLTDLYSAYQDIKQGNKLWLLRFATLFHDLGKEAKLSHYLNHPGRGGNRILTILKNLGVKPKNPEADLIRWVIINHHLLNFFIQKKDIDDPDTLFEFIHFIEHLPKKEAIIATKMLYLISYADLRAINLDIPIPYHRRTLADLSFFYKEIIKYINENDFSNLKQTAQKDKIKWLKKILPENTPDNLIKTYTEITPLFIIGSHRIKQIKKHLNMLQRINHLPLINLTPVITENYDRHIEITIAMKDQQNIGFLNKFTAVLSLHGFNIIKAEINTTKEGIIWDRFSAMNTRYLPAEEIQSIKEKIEQDLDFCIIQKHSIEELFALRKAAYTFPIKQGISHVFQPEITYMNSPKKQTVMRLATTDRQGLLHIICKILFKEFNININDVSLNTQGYLVQDIFWLDKDNKPLDQKTKTAVAKRLKYILNQKEITPASITSNKPIPPENQLIKKISNLNFIQDKLILPSI